MTTTVLYINPPNADGSRPTNNNVRAGFIPYFVREKQNPTMVWLVMGAVNAQGYADAYFVTGNNYYPPFSYRGPVVMDYYENCSHLRLEIVPQHIGEQATS